MTKYADYSTRRPNKYSLHSLLIPAPGRNLINTM